MVCNTAIKKIYAANEKYSEWFWENNQSHPFHEWECDIYLQLIKSAYFVLIFGFLPYITGKTISNNVTESYLPSKSLLAAIV